jgi:hypothetical protein
VYCNNVIGKGYTFLYAKIRTTCGGNGGVVVTHFSLVLNEVEGVSCKHYPPPPTPTPVCSNVPDRW